MFQSPIDIRSLIQFVERRIYLILALCIGASLFYWYDYRPTQIRIKCEAKANVLAAETMKSRAEMEPWRYEDEASKGFILIADKEVHYKSCLRKNGLEP